MIVLPFLIVLEVAVTANAQCDKSQVLDTEDSGEINLPTSHGNFIFDMECNWRIQSSNFDDFAVMVQIKENNLIEYSDTLTSVCASVLTIEGEQFNCHATGPFCMVYTTSDKCKKVLSEHPTCQNRSMVNNIVDINLDVYSYNAKKHKFFAEYNVIQCDENVENGLKTEELIVILIPLATFIIVALAMCIWWRSKRSKSKSSESNSESSLDRTTNEYVKNQTANIAYEAWRPSVHYAVSLPQPTEFTYEASTLGRFSQSFNTSETNIYEAIPASPGPIFSPPPRYSNNAQNYFDVGNRFTMSTFQQYQNVYEREKAVSAESQNPYDMASHDPTAPHLSTVTQGGDEVFVTDMGYSELTV